jgi:two-component system, cell cycle response regulator DivK
MDMALPGTDGYSLARELRGRPETSQLPILALSAFAMPGDAERALAAGCSDYLTKPIRRADLLERVDALLASPGDGPASPQLPPADHGVPPKGVDRR